MNNIILIGMPGSGKSTVGVLLAKMLGYSFVDTDLIIQQVENKMLYEILRDNGTEYFARVENSVCKKLQASRTVIATGGSAVFGEEGMAHLKSIGRVVYLKVSLSELKKRVKNFETRGIMRKEGQTLEEILTDRESLYEKYADLTVNCTRGSLSKNAEKIVKLLNKSDCVAGAIDFVEVKQDFVP